MPIVTITYASSQGAFEYQLDLNESLNNERTILNALRAGQVPEPEVLRTARQILKPGDTVLDIGANIGGMTIPFAKMVGPSGRVVAAEPDPANLDRLQENLGLNAPEAAVVRVVPAPVSAAPEEIVFHFNGDDSGGNALWDPARFPGNAASAAAPRSVKMSAATIDGLMADLAPENRPPKLLKIDTEGAEYLVVSGAQAALRAHSIPFILAELHEFGLAQLGHSEAMLRGFLRAHGYEMFEVFADERPPRLVSPAEGVSGPYIPNVLFAAPKDVQAVWFA
ncbi:MAG: FkbM family methyltransferase [Rhodospirillaceae bacterium]